MVKTIFVVVQMGIICLFALIHFLIGLKRGYKKTLWYFFMNIVAILFIFIILGLIPFHMMVNEKMIRDVSKLIFNSDTSYITEMLDMGGYDLVVSAIDFVFKIIAFILIYWILRLIILPLVAKSTWKKFKRKNIYATEKKQKFLGGFFGLIQGITLGFMALLPVLVLLNTADNDALHQRKDDFGSIVSELIDANQYNLVKPISHIKIGDTSITDHLFDLAFSTRIKGNHVKWRAEIAFASEVTFTILDINKTNQSIQMNQETLEKYASLFKKASKSELINLALYPGAKYLLESTTVVKEDKVSSILEQFKDKNIKVNQDILKAYDILSMFFTLQKDDDFSNKIKNIEGIMSLTEKQKEQVLNMLDTTSDLNILKLDEVLLEALLYSTYGQTLITWRGQKDEVITSFLQKVKAQEGTFLSAFLKDMGIMYEDILLAFPKEIKTLEKLHEGKDFFSGKVDFFKISDETFDQWLKKALETMGTLESGPILADPGLDFMLTYLLKSFQMDETTLSSTIRDVKGTIENKADLARETSVIFDTYEALKHVFTYKKTSDEALLDTLDHMLTTKNGRDEFSKLLKTLKKSEFITTLSGSISGPLLKSELKNSASMLDAIDKATYIDNFNLIDEMQALESFLFGLYEKGNFSLAQSIKDQSFGDKILNYAIEYMSNLEQKEDILKSNMMYAFISESLSQIKGIKIPSFVMTSDDQHALIKKEELVVLLEVMDDMHLDFKALVTGNQTDDITKAILAYSKTEKHMEKLLSSGILYQQISNLIKENASMNVPPSILYQDASSPYHMMVKKEELIKLVKLTNHLELDTFDDISNIISNRKFTYRELNEILAIDSAFVSVVLTDKIKGIEGLVIPANAYTDASNTQLKALELKALVQMLETLNMDIYDLENQKIQDIKIRDFIRIDYQTSSLIRGFITAGIQSVFGQDITAAYDRDGTLSTTEISTVFDILKSYDKGQDKISDLTNLNIESMTIFDIKKLIGFNSLVVMSLISKEILKSQAFTQISLPQEAFMDVNQNIFKKQEILSLFDTLGYLGYGDTDKLTDVFTTLNIGGLTLDRIKAILYVDGMLIHYLISYQFTSGDKPLLTLAKHEKVLSKIDLIDLIQVLSLNSQHGYATKIDEVKHAYEDLTLSKLQMLISSNSVLIKRLITNQLESVLGRSRLGNSYITEELLDTYTGTYIKDEELNKLTYALMILSGGNTQMKLNHIADRLSETSVSMLSTILQSNSELIRRKLSDTIIKAIGALKIHAHVLDAKAFIDQTELLSVLIQFETIFGSKDLTDISSELSNLTKEQRQQLYDNQTLLSLGILSYEIEQKAGYLLNEAMYDLTYQTRDGYLEKMIKEDFIEMFLAFVN